MKSRECNTKKSVVLCLTSGDDLLMSIKKCAEEHNIRSGFFTAIGGLKKISYGLYEDRKYKVINKEASHCLELLATAGNISIKEGEVLVHCHITAGDEEDGTAFGGHLMEGTIVGPFAEIFIQDVDVPLERTFDEKLNLWPLKF